MDHKEEDVMQPLQNVEIKKEITNGAESLEASHEYSNDNTEYNTHQTAVVHIRLAALKNTLQDKGSQLTQTWSELNELLCQYQAELFSKEGELLTTKTKYEGISDIEQLRNELAEKEIENSNLRQRLTDIESQNQVVQMDVSVKDSLLKKYQHDLLDKEASILTLQSANKKLDNRISMLEAKLSSSASGSGHREPSIGRYFGENANRLGSSLLRYTPAGFKRRFQTGSLQSQVKRRQIMTVPSTPSAAQSKAPIVCIEVDDDEEIKEINMGLATPQSQQSQSVDPNDPLYIDAWSDNGATETDATPQESLPGLAYGDGEYSDHHHQPYPVSAVKMAVSQSNMSLDTSIDSMNNPDLADAMTFSDGNVSISHRSISGMSPLKDGMKSNSKVSSLLSPMTCDICGRRFNDPSNLKRHVKIVHERNLRHVCPTCNKRFGQRFQLDGHIIAICSHCGGQFPCRTLLQEHVALHHQHVYI